MSTHGSSDTEEEAKALLSEEENETPTGVTLSKTRRRIMMFTVLVLQGFSFCEMSSIYPFFPAVAKNKGLTAAQMGIVLASYSIARSASSPIFGSVVSIICYILN